MRNYQFEILASTDPWQRTLFTYYNNNNTIKEAISIQNKFSKKNLKFGGPEGVH